MKILCVDDSKFILKMTGDVVRSLDLETLEAEDGKEAVEMVEKHCEEIGLILLDWNLPKMDGMQVLKWIKADDRYRHLPVIMVTAMGHKEKVVEAMKAGVSEYVAKPFKPEELAQKIKYCLENRPEKEG